MLSAILGNMAVNNFSMVLGILNGTCNYILSRMTREGADFSDVLKTAQQLGYAETDPTFDIEGVDTAHKLCLLCSLCFGTWVNLTEIHTEGIGAISSLDISFAEAFGYRIKLLAIGKRDGERIEARVHPTMIPLLHPLADVDGVFNAIRVTGDFAGPVMLSGRGAGRDATASAVLGDLLEIARNLNVGVGRRCAPLGYFDGQLKRLEMKPMGEITGKYYLRFKVEDRPGALGRIAGLLGRNGISIQSVIQASRKAGEPVPVVLIIHKAPEMDVQRAVTEIDALEIITEQSMLIRIEDNLE